MEFRPLKWQGRWHGLELMILHCGLMVASKVLFEATYANQSWSIIPQKMFPLEDINQIEREMLAYLGLNVSIQCDDLVEFEAPIRQQYDSEGADAPRHPAKRLRMRQGIHSYPTTTRGNAAAWDSKLARETRWTS
jgi:hypothetical protein